ncbi:hypothetical protein [Microbacterium sp. SD291]|uniref:hypothetical protein n=1 Tax=Microbacterium sp. SD291 TaxID=2782007 RepID=UPI001A96A78C|nr:hypothetical protein [Microbacterium sp. SD291]MBO0980157.1 hypothetical protein [Microbacterium sp. SD291]
MDPDASRSARSLRTAAAVLLIGGAVVVLCAVLMFTGRTFWGWPAPSSFIAGERALIIGSVLMSLLGFAVLELLLRSAGSIVLPRLALVMYLVGATILVSAESSFIGGHPHVYAQIVVWIVSAFLAQAAFGLALVRTALVPSGTGWSAVVWNVGMLAALAVFSPGDMYYPIVHFVTPFLIGIALLRRSGSPSAE